MNALKQRKIVPHPTKPIGGLMDDRFVYVPAKDQTVEHLREVFARARANQLIQQGKKK